MPVEEQHECFLPPADLNVKVWRYMDFTKYVSLLATESLFLSRADRFDDSYEGAMSHANKQLRNAVYKGEIPEEVFEEMSRFNEWVRTWTYINCWHGNKNESAAMWKLYSKTDDVVAIQSRFSVLKECLNREAYIGVVRYIDYERDWLPEGNVFWPYVHKRLSFEHEKEIRIVAQDLPVMPQGGLDRTRVNDKSGIHISVDLRKLIETGYVSPTAPQWFYDLVTGVTAKYGFDFPVEQSLLSKKPMF